MTVTPSFGDVTSRGRSASSAGRAGSRLLFHLLVGSAAALATGVAIALAIDWSLAPLSNAKHGDPVRGNFALRRIALAPPQPDVATSSRPADIIVFPPSVADAAPPAHITERKAGPADTVPMPPLMPTALSSLRKTEGQIAALPPASPPPPGNRVAPAGDAATVTANRTAVYDISARAVYLPNGKTLEAHSGLGNLRDNPRYVSLKNRGPTPPNVYDLSLRERLFHGVRAIRLTPVDGEKMFGRDGMLAHTYMLGPNGDSNGCVSFRNYRAFLQAYMQGDVDRLIVVPKHGAALARTAWAHKGTRALYAANGTQGF
jgi:hypothetical protein